MSHTKYNQLKIHGELLQGSDLENHCHLKLKDPSTSEWEFPIYNFILEWIDEKDEVLVKTSGSTGKAKPILLKKQHMINSAMMTQTALALNPEQNALLALSSKHIAGKMMIVRSMVIGMNLIVVEPSGNPLEDLNSTIDFTALVPYQLAQILKSKSHCNQFKKIKKVLIGGGNTDQSLIKMIEGFPNDIYASYGMTETCTHIALQKLNGESANKYFKALPGIQISIDQKSCLQIEANHLNEEVIKTNDITNIISASEFEIKGRIDNVINSGGIKIYPEEIETKLSGKISGNFIISSTPHSEFGEQIILIIESKKSDLSALFHTWKEIDLILNHHEIPKQVEYLCPFSYTESGKIDRIKMRKRIREKVKSE